jgi:AcrR family transcriptional regulator
MPVAKGATLDPARTRAEILSAATHLLYQRGLDGIGVAELCTTIGVSKETLYRHFNSKEGLVQAVLEARSDRVVRWLHDAAAGAGEEPAAQLAAVFDALAGWHAEPTFRGCAILNAATQQHTGPARTIAARHLNRHLELLTGIARRAGAPAAAHLGKQLLLLMEGATVLADHNGHREAAALAKDAALALLQASTRPCPTGPGQQPTTGP